MTVLRPLLLPIILLLITSSALAGDSPLGLRTRGFDAELLGYGGSFGAFLNFNPDQKLKYSAETDWIFVQHDDSYAYIDPYYYSPQVINQQHLSMAKLLATAIYYPFLDNMHPSFQLGLFTSAGPILAMDTADNQDFFQRWKNVKGYWSVLGRAGLHLRFIQDARSAYLVRVGYETTRFDQPIDGRDNYGGLFFQVGMEFLYR